MTLTIILALVAFVALGGCIYLAVKISATSQSGAERERIRVEETEKRFREMSETISGLNREIAEKTRLQLQAYSEQLLARQEESLREGNARQIGALVEPLNIRIREFNETVSRYYTEENAGRATLTQRIEDMMKVSVSIGEEARALTKALRNDAQKSGAWGESLLTELLERGGMKQGIHFQTQVTKDEAGGTLHGEDGRAKRPDVVVNLPSERHIIIDSKVSLTSYVSYMETDDPQTRREAARNLVKSVRNHIEEIVRADYPKVVKGSMKQVLMFMPVEGAYLLAIETDTTLLRLAAEKNVAIVSPTHLYSLVQLVDQMWNVDTRNNNVEKVAEMANDICNKANLFLRDFEKLEDQIKRVHDAYESCRTKLTGRGGLVKRSIDMKKMGVKPKTEIPSGLEDEALRNQGNPLPGEAGSLEIEAEA